VLHSLLAFVALLLTGCTATVYTSYQIATDQRSLEVQHLDTGIAGTIKARLLESDVKGAGSVDREAVAVAHRVEGVKRVETYLKAGQVSTSVLAGHVVLVGVVDHADKVKSFIQVAPP